MEHWFIPSHAALVQSAVICHTHAALQAAALQCHGLSALLLFLFLFLFMLRFHGSPLRRAGRPKHSVRCQPWLMGSGHYLAGPASLPAAPPVARQTR
jgi:hypothetical protein